MAVVLPESTEEVAAVVETLHGEGIAVVPRGAGTGLSGGALAKEDAVIVGTARLNRILSIDAENRVARVQPGLVNGVLGTALKPLGLSYAPDPSSQSACTLGGNVAENSGGPHCLKYGVTSRYVLGLEVVLSGGQVVRTGEIGGDPLQTIDLTGLFVGSEGCFGLATEIELGLVPIAEGICTLLGVFESVEDAGRAVSAIIASGQLPAAMEIVDNETIRAVEASIYAAGYPRDAGAVLVIEFDGPLAGLDADATLAEECCLREGAREVRRAEEEREREALWKGRRKAFGAMGRIAPDLLVQDATVPRARLPEVLGRITEIGARHGLRIANVFHAGDGNLHPNILFDRSNTDELERVECASREIMDVCVEAGGTISGEHGVGLDKSGYMRLVHGGEELRTMAAVKAAFDPDGLFNPGKVLPDDVGRQGGGDSAPSGPARESGRGPGRGPVTGEVRSSRSSPPVPLEPSEAWGPLGTGALGLCQPGDEAEMAAVLRWAGQEGTTVVPVGTGRHVIGDVPDAPYLLLSATRLSRLIRYEPEDLTLTAGAGVTLSALSAELGRHGQWLPFDQTRGDGLGTVGGLVAKGEAGPLAATYGATRNHVLGAEVVSGDGRMLRLGGGVVKNVAGFDLLRVLVGGLGEMAVLTSVTLRVFPVPEVELWLDFEPDDLEGSVGLARRLATAPSTPGSVTLVRDGEGPPTVTVGLQGRAETVGADREALEARVRTGYRVREASPTRRVHGADSPAVTLFAPPSRLGEALVIAAGCAPRSLFADVHAGSVRLSLSDRASGTAQADAEAVRERCRRAGIGTRIVGVPGVNVFEPVEQEIGLLAERVRRALDPGGVLWSPRP